MSEVHELLLKVHDILDKAVSKQLGNSACILAYLYNSVSRQCHEVWASQFPFLHSLRDVIPPSEACLYDHINWSLAQAHHQSSVGLSQPFSPKGGCKVRPQTGFQLTVQKRPVSRSVPGPSETPLTKRPHMECGNEAHSSGKKSAGGSVSTCSAESGRKGTMRIGTPDVPESSASSASSSSTSAPYQVGMLFRFFDQWRSITSNRFVFNMVWCHHL